MGGTDGRRRLTLWRLPWRTQIPQTRLWVPTGRAPTPEALVNMNVFIVTILGLPAFNVPCEPQGGPAEGIVPQECQECPDGVPRAPWKDPCDPGGRVCGEMTLLPTREPWFGVRQKSRPVPYAYPRLSALPTAQTWSSQARSGARLGLEAGQEARGLASPRRRPGDSLQASWLCPSSLGRPPALGLSRQLLSSPPPPPSSCRTSVRSQPQPALQGTAPQMLWPLVLSSGSQSSGTPEL